MVRYSKAGAAWYGEAGHGVVCQCGARYSTVRQVRLGKVRLGPVGYGRVGPGSV